MLATLAVALALALVSLAALAVSRLVVHPLAAFPGPRCAALTKWYECYFDLAQSPGGQFFRELSRMHDVYGPVVRINPDELHIRDPDFFDRLYAANPTRRHKYAPSAEMAGLTLGTHGTVDHDLHRRRRMANAPMFAKRSVLSAQRLIQGHIDELVGVFAAHSGADQPMNLQTVFLAYTTDVVYHYMFDRDAGYQRNADQAAQWRLSMDAVAQATPFLKQFPSLLSTLLLVPLPILIRGLRWLLPDVAGLLGTHQLMASIAAQYITSKAREPELTKPLGEQKTTKPRTLFHAIEASGLPPHEKLPRRLAQEGLTILFAGGETGSRLLAHTVYHLLCNPAVLGQVRNEVWDAVGDSNTLPDVKVLESLPWLNASVRESLRLRAATTSRLPLVCEKDLTYGHWVIPAKTPVSMSHADILHNDAIFPEAMKFLPSRWFHATAQQNRLFVPFGKGTRMCVGMDFAYSEMYMSLAAVLTRFDLELHETDWERDVHYSRDCFLGEPDPKSAGIRVKVVADRGSFLRS